MRFSVVAVCVLALSFIAGLSDLSAHGDHKAKLDIERPWARETSKSAPSGAVYLSFTYLSKHGDTLIGASSPRARMVMIHDTIMDDGVARMREAEEIKLEKGTRVVFEPGGKHIMLVGLTKKLTRGETFPVRLHFEESDDVMIQVEVTKVTGPE